MKELSRDQWKILKLLFSKMYFTDKEFSLIVHNLNPVTMRVHYNDRWYFIHCKGVPELKAIGVFVILVDKDFPVRADMRFTYSPYHRAYNVFKGATTWMGDIYPYKKEAKAYKGVKGLLSRSRFFRDTADVLEVRLILRRGRHEGA